MNEELQGIIQEMLDNDESQETINIVIAEYERRNSTGDESGKDTTTGQDESVVVEQPSNVDLTSDDGSLELSKVEEEKPEEDVEAFGIVDNVVDFFSDLSTAWNQGSLQGEMTDLGIELAGFGIGDDPANDQDVINFIEGKKKELRLSSQSFEMKEFDRIYEEAGGGWWGFLKGAAYNPSTLSSMLVSSISSQLSSIRNSEEVAAAALAGGASGAAVGAAATSYGFGVGAIPGAIAGAMSASMGMMEAGLTFNELLMEEIGGNINDPGAKDKIKAILDNPEKLQDLKTRARNRGAAIAGIELATMGLAKGVGSKLASKGIGRATRVAAIGGTEIIGGGTGEYVGRLAAGQEMDIKEIGFEAFAGLGSAPLTMSGQVFKFQKAVQSAEIGKKIRESNEYGDIVDVYKSDKDGNFKTNAVDVEISKLSKSSQILDSRVEEQILTGKLTKAEGDVIKQNFRRVQGSVSNIKSLDLTTEQEAQAVDKLAARKKLQIELDDLKKEKSPALTESKNKELEALDNELTDIIRADSKAKIEKSSTFAKKAGKAFGIEVIDDLTAADIAEQFDTDKTKFSESDGFFKDGKIYINKDVAIETRAVSVGSHELLHGILQNSLMTNKESSKIIQDFRSQLNKKQNAAIDLRANATDKDGNRLYSQETLDNAPDEYLAFFSDAIVKNEIKFDENIFTKLGDIITPILRKAGFAKIKFDTGKDVYNFMREYNKSIESGVLSKDIVKAVPGGVTIEDQAEETAKQSKSTITPTKELLNIETDTVNDLAVESKSAPLSRAKENSLIRQYTSLALKALGYSAKAGSIAPQEAVSFVQGLFPSILKNFDLSKNTKFSTHVNANITPKRQQFYEEQIGDDAVTTSLDDERVREMASPTQEPTETSTQSKKDIVPTTDPLKLFGPKNEIKESFLKNTIAKLKELNIKGLTYNTLRILDAESIAELVFGDKKVAGKILDPAKNLSQGEARRALMFVNKNAAALIKLLPENNTEIKSVTSKGNANKKVLIGGLPTGVPRNIQSKFYTKGKRIGNNTQFNKKPGITLDSFKKELGIEGNVKSPDFKVRTNTSQALRGMLELAGRAMTNTAARQYLKSIGYDPIVIEQIAEGKNPTMFSKSVLENLSGINVFQEAAESSDSDFANFGESSWNPIYKALGFSAMDPASIVDKAKMEMFFAKVLPQYLPLEIIALLGPTMTNGPASYYKGSKSFWFENTDSAKEVSEQYNEDVAVGSKYNLTEKDVSDLRSMFLKQSFTSGTGKNRNVQQKFLDTMWQKQELKNQNAAKLRGLKVMFKVFQKMIADDSRNAQMIIGILSKTSGHQNGFVRVAAPMEFIAKNIIGTEIVEEHTLPASITAKYLFQQAVAGTVDKNFFGIEKNYMQGVLSKVDDNQLKGVGIDGKKFNYIATTPNGWTIDDNIWARYFNSNVANGPGFGIDPNNIELNSGKTVYDTYGVDNTGAFIDEDFNNTLKKTAKANNLILKPSERFSKSTPFGNPEVLSLMETLDNARDLNAPVKKIRVFDFDDTLAQTKSDVLYTMPDGTEGKLNAEQFANDGSALLSEGAVFDFSEFNKVTEGKKGPLFKVAQTIAAKRGTEDVFVLTARAPESQLAIYEFLKSQGLDIPLKNITGLGDSTGDAKARWIVDKAADGYNDFYFADDAPQNVKAVKDALSVIDVKSKTQQAKIKFSKSLNLNKDFNDIIENKTGIASDKTYARVKAEVVGASKGKWKFFIPPSAEDFVGLLYSTLGKGTTGDAQMAWYKAHLLNPFASAMNNLANDRAALMQDFRALKKNLKIVPKNLRKKIPGEPFTQEQAVRAYIWDKQGMDIPGMSQQDQKDLVDFVEKDSNLKSFAAELIAINKGDAYAAPDAGWIAGTIDTDLMKGLNTTKRTKYLSVWQQNVNEIFSEENLNKLEAAYGKEYRVAMENILKRMQTGRNRSFGTDTITGRFTDWLTNSVGAIMFFNTRSAVLQTISAINFINFSDNNVLKAGQAFANQPQYWKDFVKLFNSPFLLDRRSGIKINVNEADIAEMAKGPGNSARNVIAGLLKLGFLPTQIADSFAIASGGATFYRNRIKALMKEGLSQAEAEDSAFRDFREIAEESQQSSRPDKISQQQAGPLGRIVLAFANTPAQYARLIKKAASDLKNGRGDAKTNISKIIYYGVAQNLLFATLQQALFAIGFGDEEDKEKKNEKYFNIVNGMSDSVLRGIGVGGAIASVVKNTAIRLAKEADKKAPKYQDAVVKGVLQISPPVSSKIGKLQSAGRSFSWNQEEMRTKGWAIDNPAYLASANVISAVTNIPLDRAVKKVTNVVDAGDGEVEFYKRIALVLGWSAWELGIEKEKSKSPTSRSTRRTRSKKTRSRSRTKKRN